MNGPHSPDSDIGGCGGKRGKKKKRRHRYKYFCIYTFDSFLTSEKSKIYLTLTEIYFDSIFTISTKFSEARWVRRLAFVHQDKKWD